MCTMSYHSYLSSHIGSWTNNKIVVNDNLCTYISLDIHLLFLNLYEIHDGVSMKDKYHGSFNTGHLCCTKTYLISFQVFPPHFVCFCAAVKIFSLISSSRGLSSTRTNINKITIPQCRNSHWRFPIMLRDFLLLYFTPSEIVTSGRCKLRYGCSCPADIKIKSA